MSHAEAIVAAAPAKKMTTMVISAVMRMSAAQRR
jgi:hypothetical protein